MNIRRSVLALALLFAVCVTAGFAIPSTVAYIYAQSNTVVNTFESAYVAPEQALVPVTVHKTVHNVGTESISPNGFRFVLKNTANHESFVLTTDASGYASIHLPFSAADLGKKHIYRLYEVNDAREHVTYSDRVYTIEISLSVNADNRIVADVRMDGKPVQKIVAAFENTYDAGAVPPLTGDDTLVELYLVLVLVSGAGLVLLLTRRNGRGLR